MKRLSMALTVLMVLMVGCSKKSEVNEDVIDNSNELVMSMYTEVQAIGDAIVNYYLGREYPEEYDSIVAQVEPLVNDERKVYMPEIINQEIAKNLADTLVLSMGLPGSPVYREVSEDETAVEAASGGNQEDIDVKELEKTKKFKKKMFPSGKAPDIEPLDSVGCVTEMFKDWFLEQAKKQGLLDSRIKLDSDGRYFVYSGECIKSKGGNECTVFSHRYTIPSESIGVITEDVETLQKYQLRLAEYAYYDNGYYQASYETANAEDVIKIEVSFMYTGVDVLDGDDDEDVEVRNKVDMLCVSVINN